MLSCGSLICYELLIELEIDLQSIQLQLFQISLILDLGLDFHIDNQVMPKLSIT